MHNHWLEPFTSRMSKMVLRRLHSIEEVHFQVDDVEQKEEPGAVNIFAWCDDIPRMAGSTTLVSHIMAMNLDFLAAEQEASQANRPTIHKYNPNIFYFYSEEVGDWIKFAMRKSATWHLIHSLWIKYIPISFLENICRDMNFIPNKGLLEAIKSILLEVWNASECKRKKPKRYGEVQGRRGNPPLKRRGSRRGRRRT